MMILAGRPETSTSNSARAAGAAPVVLIPVFWALASGMNEATSEAARRKRNEYRMERSVKGVPE